MGSLRHGQVITERTYRFNNVMYESITTATRKYKRKGGAVLAPPFCCSIYLFKLRTHRENGIDRAGRDDHVRVLDGNEQAEIGQRRL